MSDRERIFKGWMTLKEDIQQLAGIVQNDIKLTGDDKLYWLGQVDLFKHKFEQIKNDTMKCML